MGRFFARLSHLSNWVIDHSSTALNISDSPVHYFTTSRHVSELTELLYFGVLHGSLQLLLLVVEERDTCAVLPLIATLGSIGSLY